MHHKSCSVCECCRLKRLTLDILSMERANRSGGGKAGRSGGGMVDRSGGGRITDQQRAERVRQRQRNRVSVADES